LIALDKETTNRDIGNLAKGGALLFDGDTIDFTSDDPNHLSIPFGKIASEVGKSKMMINSVATGAEQFQQKSSEILENNLRSVKAGYEFVRQNLKIKSSFTVPLSKNVQRKMLLTGSQAIALGAMASGLKFYSGYPMSPATSIMEFAASQAENYNIVDMVIGANFAGARAMTATSGGGFCLMAEALSLAGMTETPAVIIVGQRPGPSTGLPTRTEQLNRQT
jgi:2-oxoglutarate ferredoxin oxidoreductase subunit alpha